MIVVSDTTPLSELSKVGKLDLLRKRSQGYKVTQIP